jgi:hypothetical protein
VHFNHAERQARGTPPATPALVLACLLGLLPWVAQSFGGLTTGQATDPNSGALPVLLAACFWPWTGRETAGYPGDVASA